MSGGAKTVRFWALKIFIITLIVATGISALAELFLMDLGVISAALIVVLLIIVGIIFDIIGVAFASCDQKPFIAMSSRKIIKAKHALRLLKNAEVVSNICNDVIGDICGIVSGAAGAAIAVKAAITATDTQSFIISIGISGFIGALTVGGKALGKKVAMKNNIVIVEAIGSFLAIFERDSKKDKVYKKEKGGGK